MMCDKFVELKENRALFARMALASRSRPDLDIEGGIGTYEFSAVSRALFASDGTLLPCKDKSNLAKCLEQVPKQATRDEVEDDDAPSQPKVIIIDAMVIVQQVAAKETDVKSCTELAQKYINALEQRIADYDVVHLVFDHYDNLVSLKQATRDRRKGNIKAEKSFVCTDSTPIVR